MRAARRYSPMRFSRIFIPTAREAQKGLIDRSVAWLSRAGYVSADAEAGDLDLLPLGFMLWERIAFTFRDLVREKGVQVVDFKEMAEDSLSISRKAVKSYRQLPLSFAEIGTRRIDACGFAADADEATLCRDGFLDMARQISREGGLTPRNGRTIEETRHYVALAAERGSWRSKEGFLCTSCDWCGDDAAPSSPAVGPSGGEAPLREVETPGADTIAELCRQLGVSPDQTLKTLFYAAEQGTGKEVLAVLTRGDHQVNDRKLSHALGGVVVRFADPLEIREAVGDLAGYLGPVGLPPGIRILADRHVEGSPCLVAGANKVGFHLLNACWGRDYGVSAVADLVSIQEGFPCPLCGSPIVASPLRSIAVAMTDPESSPLTFQREGGALSRAHRWEGTLCVTPLALSLVGHEKIPPRFAPFDVNILIASMRNDDAVGLGNVLAERLEESGFRVLLDDRDERAGVKFSDAELVGLPVTVVVGREASEGIVEVWRPDGAREELPAGGIADRIQRWIR
jgi:prolyl-tRNA synthetase